MREPFVACPTIWQRVFDKATRTGRGRPLPAGLRRKMEAYFGESFAAVRIYVSAEVAALGAVACAHDATLLFAPGRYDPKSPSGQRLIGHELVHVLQQRHGRIREAAAAPAVLCDERLEAEADWLGTLAAEAATPHANRRKPTRKLAVDCGGRARHTFQFKVEILNDPNDIDFRKGKAEVVNSAEQAAQKINAIKSQSRFADYGNYYVQHTSELHAILNAWIGGGYMEMLPFAGGTARALHTRRYRDYGELLRALVAEHRAQQNIAKETELAKEAFNSPFVKQHLSAALHCVYLKICDLRAQKKDAILKELDGWEGCAYKFWYKKTWSCRNIGAYFSNPNPEWVTENITIYHDLMQYFLLDADGNPLPHYPKKTCGQGLIKEPKAAEDAYSLATFEDIGFSDADWAKLPKEGLNLDQLKSSGKKVQIKVPLKDDYRNNLATPNENKLVTQSARENDMPMWASHSWTTLRMMLLTRWASEGCIEHHEAVAWAIFAFWNQSALLQGMNPIHRFHEVMDIAANFGVPYEPFKYPNKLPGLS